MKLRVLMKRLMIEQAEFDGHNLIFAFHAATPVPPQKILGLLDDAEGRYRFSPDYRLSIRIGRCRGEEVLTAAKKELRAFL